VAQPLGCGRTGKGGGPIRGFFVSLLAVGLWLVVIAAVAWMFHSTPASNRSIRRFRRARRSLASQDGRRHRSAPPAPARPAAGSGTSTVVVMAGTRRSRDRHLMDSRELGPRPARWPADGWSLGSLAPSGPRLAWAGGARPEAPWERSRRSRRDDDLEAVETSMPYVGRPSAWAGSRSSLPGAGRADSPGSNPAGPAGQRPQGFGRPVPGFREQAASSQDGGTAWSARRLASSEQRAAARQGTPVQAPMQSRAGGRSPQAAGHQAGAARWTVLDLARAEPGVRAARRAEAARGEAARAPGARREADAGRRSPTVPATPSTVPSLPQVFRLNALREPGGAQSAVPQVARASGTDGRPTYRRVGDVTYVAVNRRVDREP